LAIEREVSLVAAIPSAHTNADFSNPEEELHSSLDRQTPEQLEAATSNHLIRLIDFFFALVLGQGIVQFADAISSPFDTNVVAWLALLTIYYTVVRSFVAWHAAIESRRYRMLTEAVRTTELWRVYIDVAIVALYSYMLFVAKDMIVDPEASIAGMLWALPVLFVLYYIWGYLRKLAWGEDEFEFRFLLLFGAAYTLLALGYTLLPTDTFSIGNEAGNLIGLSISLALMVLYRYVNFWQGFEGRQRWRLLGIPKPRRPMKEAAVAKKA
jgi:hypothetical protein